MAERPLPIRAARTHWTTLVAVCEECKGGKRFAKALRRELKESGASARVVRSSCLDVCPKRGVTVATLRGGHVITVIVDDRQDEAVKAFALTSRNAAEVRST